MSLNKRMPAALAVAAMWVAPNARAGGTWVGNSPLAVAFSAFTDYPYALEPGMEAEEPPAAPEEAHNSLLLRKGESRLALGFGQHYTFTSGDLSRVESGKLSFDYGLNRKLTLMNFTTLGYSLKAGSGRGHEFAVLAGLTDGFSYQNFRISSSVKVNGEDTVVSTRTRRYEVGPGAAVLHSWTGDNWRWMNSFSVSSTVAWEKNSTELTPKPSGFAWSDSSPMNGWQDLTMRLRTALYRRLDERWALGFSTETYVARYNDFKGLRSVLPEKARWLVANPAASLTRKLGTNAQFEYVLGSDGSKRPHYKSTSGPVQVSHYLTVSARW